MIFVLGSGPAGVAAAAALLKRGCAVTMLDVGLTLPADKAKQDADVVLDIKNPIKLAHGSDYPYAEVSNHIDVSSSPDVSIMPSFARGGLSNVWGAYTEFYNDADLKKWPFDPANLQKYYPVIKEMIGATDCIDDIGSGGKSGYRSSQQAALLRGSWTKHTQALSGQGLSFGAPTLACWFGTCTYCRRCQTGCPDDLVYSARHTLDKLLADKNFSYVGDVVVDRLEDHDQTVVIHAYSRSDRRTFTYTAERVFIACGAFMSTRLLMEADRLYNQPVAFLDSTHFLLPSVMFARAPHVDQQALHTLAQLYLKLDAPEIASNQVNIQIYTYMSHYKAMLESMLGPAYGLAKKPLSLLLDRLLAIQAHLHHEDSHGFSMAVAPDRHITLEKRTNPRTRRVIWGIVKRLTLNAHRLGFAPLVPMLSESKVGRSFHYGASLPMSHQPNGLETTAWGQPSGHHKWHFVDASVFPTIPAGSIAPMIMANAYRIASECPLDA